MAAVIGETTDIGDDVTIYQGVTLGGTSTQQRQAPPDDRGPVTIFDRRERSRTDHVGRHSRIGAGSVLVTSVPAHSTVVGIPGKVVKTGGKHTETGKPVIDLDSADLPDPVSRALGAVLEQVERLEKKVDELSARAEGRSEIERPELRKVAGDEK